MWGVMDVLPCGVPFVVWLPFAALCSELMRPPRVSSPRLTTRSGSRNLGQMRHRQKSPPAPTFGVAKSGADGPGIAMRGILRPRVGLERFQLSRVAAPDDLAPFTPWFWTVQWDLPESEIFEQEVLAFPCVNLACEDGAYRVHGPATTRYVAKLSGRGWVTGARFTPARPRCRGEDRHQSPCPDAAPGNCFASRRLVGRFFHSVSKRVALVMIDWYANADGTTALGRGGISSKVRSAKRRPAFFFKKPPHCLKKNGTRSVLHSCWMLVTQRSSIVRAPGPLSPPTMTQSMPFTLSAPRSSRSGSTERNLTLAVVERSRSSRASPCFRSSTLTPHQMCDWSAAERSLVSSR
jgi:hypothetical protein